MNLNSLIFTLMFLPLTLHAAAGGQEGGGGSQAELDFVQIARFATYGIQNSISANEGLFSGFNLDSFKKAVGSVQIHGVSSLCTNEIDPGTGVITERCLDASYSPENNQIQLNDSTWVAKSCTEKMSIAVHEFGRASSNENGDYAYSSKVGLSAAMAAQCVPYDNQAGSQTLSCLQKANYLDAALQSLNNQDTSTTVGVANYAQMVRGTMIQWSAGVGKGCPNEGQATCMRTCFLKAGSNCFSVCATN